MSSNRPDKTKLPLLIGITGGIGSGKSTVSKLLRQKGYAVFDCDAYSRQLTKKGSPVLAEIAREFGADNITKDGRLNRKRLAKTVFASAERTEKLNSLIHGKVLEGMKEFYGLAERALENDPGSPRRRVAFSEIPLLYEAGWQRYLDRVWLVTASEDTRISRVRLRDPSISEEDIRARISRQMPEDEKAKKADLIFLNEGSREDLEAQLGSALEELGRE